MGKATDNLILDLVRDYEDYLGDFTYAELQEIARNGVFTLAEARGEVK